jgi:hypothetical protein
LRGVAGSSFHWRMDDLFAPSGPSLGARREGFLAGAPIGAALAAQTFGLVDANAIRATLLPTGEVAPLSPAPGRRHAATALADGLLEELVSGGVDLRRLADRWIAWGREDGTGIDPALGEGLAHLREFQAPALTLPAHGPAPLTAVLPAALTAASPKTMLAGTFHTARLLDPSESTSLAAVALVVAASRLLQGFRDFIPDVLSVLRLNDAPAELFAQFAAIPRDVRTPPPLPRGVMPAPDLVAVWVLWQVHHRPRAEEVLRTTALAGDVSPHVGALLGALLGARDGMVSWPPQWREGAGEEVTLRLALAGRLGG